MWASLNRRPLDARMPVRQLAVFCVVASLFYLLYTFVVPQIRRFRFRGDLSWYDLGLHGFSPSRTYVSFRYTSPVVEISQYGSGCNPGFTFLAPRGDSIPHPGPMILDARGDLVWMKHNLNVTQDFKVQWYRGQKYLTYWEGEEVDGRGRGTWYMLDQSYTKQFEIKPAGVLDGDLHDFQISKDDTALVTIYQAVTADLRPIGGPESGWIYDSLFQEIDIATGDLIFEWHASHHFPVDSTFEERQERGAEPDSALDFFHINSIDKDPQGNYLVSARHTHTISQIDGTSGAVLWTLGGKLNEFTDQSDGAATNFSWQHDARWHGDNILTFLDNAANSNDDLTAQSRAMVVEVDIPTRQVQLRRAYYHPQEMKALSQGNVQVLDGSGNIFAGWGHSAAFTEFDPDGTLLCDVHFGASAYFTFGRVVSYRVFKGSWVGRPLEGPSAEVSQGSVFVSWNGATEVSHWRLDVGDGRSLEQVEFQPRALVEKRGFETKIPLPEDMPGPYFRLAALDSQNEVLGYTGILSARSSFPREQPVSLAMWYWISTAFVFVAIGFLFKQMLSRRVTRVRNMKPQC